MCLDSVVTIYLSCDIFILIVSFGLAPGPIVVMENNNMILNYMTFIGKINVMKAILLQFGIIWSQIRLYFGLKSRLNRNIM
jgi:hypothetical protein